MENIRILMFFAVLVVGLISIAVAVKHFMKAKTAAETWLTASGVILSSNLDLKIRRSSKGHTVHTYQPQVSYEYTVMGQSYTGDHISFGSGCYNSIKTDKIIAAYPKDAQVTVHYDPADPSKSVLETKATAGMAYLVKGIVFIVPGAMVLLGFPK
jgi:hypothetical protein